MPLYKPFPKFILRPVITIFIGLFIMVWLTMMTTALTGALCGNPDKPDAKRLRGCNISIPLGNLLPGDDHKKASLYLQRGILRANAGATDLAPRRYGRGAAVMRAVPITGWKAREDRRRTDPRHPERPSPRTGAASG